VAVKLFEGRIRNDFINKQLKDPSGADLQSQKFICHINNNFKGDSSETVSVTVL